MGCWWLCWWECSALLEIGTGGFCCLLVSVELQRKMHTSQFTDTKHIILFSYVTFTRRNTNICSPFQTQTTLFSPVSGLFFPAVCLQFWIAGIYQWASSPLTQSSCCIWPVLALPTPIFQTILPIHQGRQRAPTSPNSMFHRCVCGWNRMAATNDDIKGQPKLFAIHALKNILSSYWLDFIILSLSLCLSFPCHIVLSRSAIALSFYLPSFCFASLTSFICTHSGLFLPPSIFITLPFSITPEMCVCLDALCHDDDCIYCITLVCWMTLGCIGLICLLWHTTATNYYGPFIAYIFLH